MSGRFPRVDALSKACGAERFAADHYPEGCLWAGAFRPGAAHARVLAVHTAEALALPGVLQVLTAADVPGTNLQGIVHKDQPVLCGDVVRHAGDPVALVLAESREALERALGLLRADLEPLPAVFDPREAMRPGAPRVHAGREGGNVLMAAEIRKGDAARALAACPVVVRGTFETPRQAPAFLETECGVARRLPDGTLDLIVSTQSPFRDRFEVAQALGLDPLSVRVRAPYLGGGFGGKDGATVQCLLALAALHADGRPVRMAWSREESFTAGYKRHPSLLRCELGADRDGTLRALRCRMVLDTGAYAHLGGEVLELGMEHMAGPYRVPHVLVRGFCVYTNNPVSGAMRGFGVAQATFCAERMMDRLAAKLGLDPLELRLKNVLGPGEENACGVRLTGSTEARACLTALRGHPFWTTRREWAAQAPARTRRGVAVALAHNAMGYGGGLPDMAAAKVELTEEGRFRVYCAVSDMGQGNVGGHAVLAAQALNQPPGELDMVLPDTERCHPSGSSSAGRTTYTFGNAVLKACAAMTDKLRTRAAQFLLCDDPASLVLESGRVVWPGAGKSVPLALMARFLPRDDRVCVAEFVMPVAREVSGSSRGFVLGFPHLLFAYSAHLARVELDELTGRVRVADYFAATDGGGVVLPQGFEQQIQGGAAQGLGLALMEDCASRDGRLLTPDLSTYLVPTALDLPEIGSLAVPSHESSGPGGLKGVGEVAMDAPLPAVASAVEQAAGIRLDAAPLTPERVLAALRRTRKKKP